MLGGALIAVAMVQCRHCLRRVGVAGIDRQRFVVIEAGEIGIAILRHRDRPARRRWRGVPDRRRWPTAPAGRPVRCRRRRWAACAWCIRSSARIDGNRLSGQRACRLGAAAVRRWRPKPAPASKNSARIRESRRRFMADFSHIRGRQAMRPMNLSRGPGPPHKSRRSRSRRARPGNPAVWRAKVGMSARKASTRS